MENTQDAVLYCKNSTQNICIIIVGIEKDTLKMIWKKILPNINDNYAT